MVDRITVHTIGPDPRGAALVAGARLVGLTSIAAIDVADVYFVEGDLSPHVCAELEALVVDPLLQQGAWGDPISDATGDAVETALLPGVTDSVATAVLDAAAVLDLPIRAAATGHRYVVSTTDGLPLAEDVLHRLATRLLSNAVIERVALGSIAPAFAHAVTPAPVELIEV
ncbi:MAG: phosphoribosylformylglycinamidine synthase subunit PurS/phosphoribosylformylglycinamidine synthase, partial [Actinomycetota bacterium]